MPPDDLGADDFLCARDRTLWRWERLLVKAHQG
jgi:hypothetical protein